MSGQIRISPEQMRSRTAEVKNEKINLSLIYIKNEKLSIANAYEQLLSIFS